MNVNPHEINSSNDKKVSSASSVGKNKTESYENLLINKYLDDIQQTE